MRRDALRNLGTDRQVDNRVISYWRSGVQRDEVEVYFLRRSRPLPVYWDSLQNGAGASYATLEGTVARMGIESKGPDDPEPYADSRTDKLLNWLRRKVGGIGPDNDPRTESTQRVDQFAANVAYIRAVLAAQERERVMRRESDGNPVEDAVTGGLERPWRP